MKGALRKELKSTIKFNRSRFISIIVIIFLGVSFFIGMTNNSVVLRSAMNNYLEENNYWDIKVYSYLGLTKDDIEQIKNKVEDIDDVEAKYYVEALTTIEDADGKDIYENENLIAAKQSIKKPIQTLSVKRPTRIFSIKTSCMRLE